MTTSKLTPVKMLFKIEDSFTPTDKTTETHKTPQFQGDIRESHNRVSIRADCNLKQEIGSKVTSGQTQDPEFVRPTHWSEEA